MLGKLKNKAVITLATIATVLGISAGNALSQEPATKIDPSTINLIRAPDGKTTVQYNFDPTDPELEQIIIEKRGFDGYHRDIQPIASTSINGGKNMAMMFNAKPTKGTAALKNYFVDVNDSAINLYELNTTNPLKNIDGWNIDPQKRLIEYVQKENAASQKMSFGEAISKAFAKVGAFPLVFFENCDDNSCYFHMNDTTQTTRNASTFPAFFNNFQLNRVKPEDKPVLDTEMKKSIGDYSRNLNCGLDESKIETIFNPNSSVNDFKYETFSIQGANAECKKNRGTVLASPKGILGAYDTGHIQLHGRTKKEREQNVPPYKIKVSKKFMDITLPGIMQELKEQGINVAYIDIPESIKPYAEPVTSPSAVTQTVMPGSVTSPVTKALNYLGKNIGFKVAGGMIYDNQKIKTVTGDNVQKSEYNGILPALDLEALFKLLSVKGVYLMPRGGANWKFDGNHTIDNVESFNKSAFGWNAGGNIGYENDKIDFSLKGLYLKQNENESIASGDLTDKSKTDLQGIEGAVNTYLKLGKPLLIEAPIYSRLSGEAEQDSAVDLTRYGGNVDNIISTHDLTREKWGGRVKFYPADWLNVSAGYFNSTNTSKSEGVESEEKLNEVDFGIELTPLKILGNWGIKFNYTPGWSYDREMGGDKTIHNVGLKGVYTFGGKKYQLK